MKIIYCLACTCNPGGIERIVIQKANWLASHGHDICIVTTEQGEKLDYFPLHESVRRIDLNVMYSEDINNEGIHRLIIRSIKMNRHKRMLKRLLAIEKPDITISTFGNESRFLYKIKDAGSKLLEIHFTRFYRLKNPVGFLHKLANRFMTWRDGKLIDHYDAFVCLTKQDKENWKRKDKIHIIPNFTNFQSDNITIKINKRVIAVGRLSYEKAHHKMIAAWQIVNERHPDWKFDLYGEGDLKDDLNFQINRLGLSDKITIHPAITDIDLQMKQSDILLMTSIHEGFPMVIPESLACGTPVISFDFACGPRDILFKDNGIIVENGNVYKLANAICDLIENPQELLRLKKGAIASSKKYKPEAVMCQWVKLFNSLKNG